MVAREAKERKTNQVNWRQIRQGRIFVSVLLILSLRGKSQSLFLSKHACPTIIPITTSHCYILGLISFLDSIDTVTSETFSRSILRQVGRCLWMAGILSTKVTATDHLTTELKDESFKLAHRVKTHSPLWQARSGKRGFWGSRLWG